MPPDEDKFIKQEIAAAKTRQILGEPIMLLRNATGILKNHPVVLVPILISVFIQFLILEILYFAPRYPLNIFFAPMISKLWSPLYVHYPFDLILLPKLFYYITQIVISLLLSEFLLGVSVTAIAAINNDEKITFGRAFRKTLPAYFDILLASLISYGLFWGYSQLYGKLMLRALKIHSEAGPFFLLKKTVLLGAPYFQFLAGILLTTLLIYVVPIIIIERRKVFPAIWLNFKSLFRSFSLTLLCVFIPTILYLPIFIVRNTLDLLNSWMVPDVQLVIIAFSILLTAAIDVIIITAVTTNYLFKKEQQ